MDHKLLLTKSRMRVLTILSCLVATSASHWLGLSLENGQNVDLTFDLFEGFSKNHEINGFSVVRDHHEVLDAIEPVVECVWFPSRNLRCLETPGYKLIKPITDTVTIVIKNYTYERHGGSYSCQTTQGQQIISETCRIPLDFKDIQTEMSRLRPYIRQTTDHPESEQHENIQTEMSRLTPDIHQTTDHPESEQHKSDDRGTIVYIGVILSVFIVLLLIIAIFTIKMFLKVTGTAPNLKESDRLDTVSGEDEGTSKPMVTNDAVMDTTL